MAKAKQMPRWIEYLRLGAIQFAVRNPKEHDLGALHGSLGRFGVGSIPTRDERTGRLVAGHGRITTLRQMREAGKEPPSGVVLADDGEWLIPVACGWTSHSDADAEAYLLADNRTSELGGWDDPALAAMLKDLAEANALDGTGYDGDDVDKLLKELDRPLHQGGLAERFLAPPFTVLDARQGYWRQRKEAWWALGVDPTDGLPGDMLFGDQSGIGGERARTRNSAFDPVLAELICRWFAPDQPAQPGLLPRVLDPFGGEAVKGIVAACVGLDYTGVELRREQVQANNLQAHALFQRHPDRWTGKARWTCGDSAKLAALVPERDFDLVFTSPPYFDLESYEGGDQDGSGLGSFRAFMDWYAGIFAQAVAKLAEGRFLVVKVGEVRDDSGAYVNFVGENIRLFLDLGLHYYNEAVLVTPVGSLPLRAGRQFSASRKLAKGHQNVLIFWKGDPSAVHFPEVEVADLPSEEDSGG